MPTKQQASPSNGLTPAAIVETPLLDSIVEKQQELAQRYRPVMGIKDSIDRYKLVKQYLEEAMVEDEDYGKVPGIDKPFLFQAGAEKLMVLFGYVPTYAIQTEIEDWAGAQFGEPLFYYRMRCILQRDGAPVGEGIGSASTWESKYRYRWVGEDDIPSHLVVDELKKRGGSISEFAFAIDKSETSGKYGKPVDYWQRWKDAIESRSARKIRKKMRGDKESDAWEMDSTVFRIPNPDFADNINTVQKMATKRAKIAAVIAATGLSALFTQDEDSGVLPGNDVGSDTPAQTSSDRKSSPSPERPNEPEVHPQLRSIHERLRKNMKNFASCVDEIRTLIVGTPSVERGGADAYNRRVDDYNKVLADWRIANPKGKEVSPQGALNLLNELWALHELTEAHEEDVRSGAGLQDELPAAIDEGWPEGRE